MAGRTRLALVTVIILVGCIFAIPHFRHPMGDTAEVAKESVETEVDKVASNLKLKMETDSDKSNVSETPRPSAIRNVDPLNQNSILVQHEIEPVSDLAEREDWKFPPISELPKIETFDASGTQTRFDQYADSDQRDDNRGRRARLEPRPIGDFNSAFTSFARQTPRQQNELKPIRLVGEQVGQQEVRQNLQRNTFEHQTQNRFARQASQSPENGNARRTLGVEQTALRLREQNMFSNPRQAADRRSAREPTYHRIVNGDTLERLSQQYYGNPEQALLIFEANRQALYNPTILPIGMELIIPNLDQKDLRRPQRSSKRGFRALQPIPLPRG